MPALAYHLTWTTYGTWLPGDARGWVKWGEVGVKLPDPQQERDARRRMVESAVVLTDDQRPSSSGPSAIIAGFAAGSCTR